MLRYHSKIQFFLCIITLCGNSDSLNAMHWVNNFLKPKKIITRVRPNSAKRITLLSDSQQTSAIRTDGLIGCHATLMYVDEQSRQHLLLTHYAPRSDQYAEHTQKLAEEIRNIPLQGEPKKIVFISAIAGSCEGSEHNQNIRYHDEACKAKVLGLTETAFKALHDRSKKYGLMMEHIVIPYGQLPPTGKAYLTASVEAELSNEKRSQWKISPIIDDTQTFEF